VNINHQEILTTLANPHWKAEMCFQLMDTQGCAEHDRTVRTLEGLIEHDAPRRAFWQRCLALYKKEAWDL
jgi:hypothetical protein